MERIRGTQNADYGHIHVVCVVVLMASILMTSLMPSNTEGLMSTLVKSILLYNECRDLLLSGMDVMLSTRTDHLPAGTDCIIAVYFTDTTPMQTKVFIVHLHFKPLICILEKQIKLTSN